LIECVAQVARACTNTGDGSRGFRVLLCLVEVANDERIRRVLRRIFKEEEALLGRSARCRTKEGVTKASRRTQKVIVKLFSHAMARVLGNADLVGGVASGADLWRLLDGSGARANVVQWLSSGGLGAAQLVAAGVCTDLADAVAGVGGTEKNSGDHRGAKERETGQGNRQGNETKDTSTHATVALDPDAVRKLLTAEHRQVVASILKGHSSRRVTTVTPAAAKDSAPAPERFIPLRLSLDNGNDVRMVTTLESAHMLRQFLEKEIATCRCDGVLVGIDTEWGDDGLGCALVQIATVNTVFLIDLMPAHRGDPAAGYDSADAAALVAALRWLMSEPRLMKIGFSFGHDWEQLEKIAPGVFQMSKSVMDLQTYIVNEALAETGRGDLVGLSTVVKRHLGASLDKTEQCSAWCQRPLSINQIRYAALDALVLVDLAAVLGSTK
jgi:hypothetical protein